MIARSSLLRATFQLPRFSRISTSLLSSPTSYRVPLSRTMSSTDSLSKLSSPLQQFVRAATAESSSHASDKEASEVSQWLSTISSSKWTSSSDLKQLEQELAPKTYLIGTSPTAADVALYGTLHPLVSGLSPSDYWKLPSITRYFDHIQNLPSVRSAPGTFPIVPFDFTNAPKIERVAEAPKKKEKGAPKDANSSTPAPLKGPAVAANTIATESSTPTQPGKKEKKEKAPKKEGEAATAASSGKKDKGGAAPPAAPAADAGEPVPSMIDLRVGKIIEVARHPDADGLYVEQIDIGEETGPRTVVSGLVHYIPIEQMRDRTIIVVANLKPANMRGVKSFAMVLCATSKDGKEGGIEFVEPPAGSKPGERVYFEGEKYQNAQPLPQLNPKKKIFETIQPGFTTLPNREAAWIDPASGSVHRIVTKDGVCAPKTLVGASLS